MLHSPTFYRVLNAFHTEKMGCNIILSSSRRRSIYCQARIILHLIRTSVFGHFVLYIRCFASSQALRRRSMTFSWPRRFPSGHSKFRSAAILNVCWKIIQAVRWVSNWNLVPLHPKFRIHLGHIFQMILGPIVFSCKCTILNECPSHSTVNSPGTR